MHNVVIVGVGEVVEQVPENLENAASPLDLMVAAAKSALKNSGKTELSSILDTIAVVRTTSDSAGTLKSPFGDAANYPRSVAHHIGADPEHAYYSKSGGSTPQSLVNTFSHEIRIGQKDAVLIVGAEAYSTVHVSQMYNELTNIAAMYSLFENARRGQNDKSHPNSMFQKAYSAEQIATITDSNKPVTDIYTRAMVAKDGVNLGASIILMSEEKRSASALAVTNSSIPSRGVKQKTKLCHLEQTSLNLPRWKRPMKAHSTQLA